jgi:sulfatase modifying factor 1
MWNRGHTQVAFWMSWSLLWISSTGCQQSTTPKPQNTVAFVEIPPGEFLMGAEDPAEFGTYSAPEGPQHRVRLTRPFQMSRCEITVGEFRRFVEATGYVTEAEETGQGCNGLNLTTGEVEKLATRTWHAPGFEQSDDHPVVCVSHRDAVRFCEWLSGELKGTVRLPTEAEWEYCCRAGTASRYSSGDEPETLNGVANCGDRALAAKIAAFDSTAAGWDDKYAFTAPVGTFAPNKMGLHDMHGNVGEWCADWFDAEYYLRSEVMNPTGPGQSEVTPESWHVVRGGSWYNAPISLRSSGRHDGVPTEASTTNGFRVVME